ncbi:pitrilysin family protein [Conexibacter sp. DBS9H8]|uniref:M16 family metallopeptidase n=1 Tax=Conexibacter sp. DBS9H8 TaxID=2937801 RepID=UPI00200E3663|nr:pitrilysin family protein [Conexibacter sp. DBS9H8]
MLSHRETTLPAGVRIVTEAMPSVRSVTLGFWIGTGSRGESEAEAGLSHLLEHLLFKGTRSHTSLEIDQIFDTMGAEINAGTGRETTSLYARVLDEHLPRALSVMAEMVFAPTLDDIDAEREVILEEIAMYEDDPQEKIFDLLGETVFGHHPLGRAIIGYAPVIASTPAAGIRAFHAGRYVPANVVVAAAGAVDHDQLVAHVDSALSACGDRSAVGTPPAVVGFGLDHSAPAQRRFEAKETEQFHICLGASALSRHDPRRFGLRVLDTIFGGASSSRLFQEVRERRGLAYSVYSFAAGYADTGQIGLYVGTRPENVEAALAVVGSELARVVENPATDDELARAKENLKGRMLLALESTGARMNRLGSSVLAGEPLLSLDEIEAAIDAVSLAELAELAGELWDPARLSVVGIGPDEDRFDAAADGLGLPAVAA